MSNDLIQSGGSIAPYSPASPSLPASSTPVGGADYLSDHSNSGNQISLFGYDLPNGTTPEHAELAVLQIVTVFKGDAKQLGVSKDFIDQAAAWFKQAALHPVNESKNHSFNLSNLTLPPGDAGLINAFCNWAQSIGANQEDVRKSLYWYSLLVAKVAQAQNAQVQPQQQKPLAGKSIGKVSEAEYRSILRNQDQAILNCQENLKTLWGHKYRANLNIALSYYHNALTAEEQNHLQSTVIGNRMALNDPEVIERMYLLAIDSGQNQPGSLVEINRQIDEIEKIMTTKRYRADNEMQARYRQLIDARIAAGG